MATITLCDFCDKQLKPEELSHVLKIWIGNNPERNFATLDLCVNCLGLFRRHIDNMRTVRGYERQS